MTRVLLIALAALAGCNRLGHVGREPGMSPVDEPTRLVAPTIPPGRAALAQPRPAEYREGFGEASLWRSGPASLFGDRRAADLGDILTVVIEISDEAEISNSTARSRAAGEDLAIPNLVGLEQQAQRGLPTGVTLDPAVGITSSSSSRGDGSVSRSEELTLRIAATVVNVLPNGHLVIQGNQEVRVNFELRDLQIAGIVRPEDIDRRNQVTYDKIAGARISYGGRGQITDVQQPRYGQQVADILLPF